MAELAIEEKVKIAANFILDSPPGEFHEVLNDIRVLVNNDIKLQAGVKSAVHQYNVSEFITAPLTNDVTVLVSKYGELDENTYFDPRLKQQFKFDHVRQTVSDVEPYTVTEKNEALRATFDAAFDKYASDHYPQGVSAVFVKDSVLSLLVVSNKYNPANFWNGRWRSEWNYDSASGSLTGTLRNHVHYYEDGNVQLHSDKNVSATIKFDNADSAAAAVIKFISEAENEYQTSLNENYAQLSETTFKALRRQLPVTKTKLDWNKILNYKVGAAIAR